MAQKMTRVLSPLDCPISGSPSCEVTEIHSGPHGQGARIDWYDCQHGYIVAAIVTRWEES